MSFSYSHLQVKNSSSQGYRNSYKCLWAFHNISVLKATLLSKQNELKCQFYSTIATDVVVYIYGAGFNVIVTWILFIY